MEGEEGSAGVPRSFPSQLSEGEPRGRLPDSVLFSSVPPLAFSVCGLPLRFSFPSLSFHHTYTCTHTLDTGALAPALQSAVS